MADIIAFPQPPPHDDDEDEFSAERLRDVYVRILRARYGKDVVPEEAPIVAPAPDGSGAWVESWAWVPKKSG